MPLVDQREVMTAFADRLAARRAELSAGPVGVAPAQEARAASARTVWEVLEARRSVRSFDARPVAAAELSAVLARALTDHRAQWPDRPADLTVLLAAYRVEGLAAGWYAVGPDGGFGAVTGAPDLPDPVEVYDGAPAVLVVGGDLAAAVRRADQAGYTDLLVRAGMLAHGCWLTAIAAGLGGCLRGRAQGPATAALHAAQPGGRHLLSLTLGHPVPVTGGPGDGTAAAR
ncbi:nitroreductase family protein [Kitasatospora paracochleata]|uniref:Nitroreductase n=1 Tax=Kitasatospora paracochleata TaxID=58354 RepID=A0ABT1ISX4_9ACTN|nr:nitroreductase family protein [Kitasatospora paracochleata]MCP2308245.1 nitroreductase [Kitasatospora paracochleata]